MIPKENAKRAQASWEKVLAPFKLKFIIAVSNIIFKYAADYTVVPNKTATYAFLQSNTFQFTIF